MGMEALGGLLLGGGLFGAAKLATKALAGSPKSPPPVVPMPDVGANPLLQLQKNAQTGFRTGRAATVLTDNADTGDKLGP